MDGWPKVQSIAPLARPMDVIVLRHRTLDCDAIAFEYERIPVVGLGVTAHGVEYLVHDRNQRCPVPLDEWEEESLQRTRVVVDVVEQGGDAHVEARRAAIRMLTDRLDLHDKKVDSFPNPSIAA